MAEKPEEHLSGVSDNEQRMYEHVVESAAEDDRCRKRTEEVAARTVMKHPKEEGHTKGK